MLVMGFLIGTSTLIIPVGPARQDAWIAFLLAGGLGVGLAYLYTSLGKRFPGETPLEYSLRVLGRWGGTILNVLFIWYAFHLASLVLLNIAELYTMVVMITTPLIVFIGVMAGLAALAARAGLETIARLAELLTPFIVLTMLTLNILCLATPNLVRWENLLPIMAEGPIPVVRGMFDTLAFPFGETVFFLVLLPFVVDPGRTRRPFCLAVILVSLLLSSVLVRNITVLGAAESNRTIFPSLAAVRLINIGDVLQRMDSLIIFIWTFAGFLKLSIVYYIFVLGTAQLFKLKDVRPLTLPVWLLLTFFTPHVYENVQEMLVFAGRVWPFYFLPLYLFHPALLLLVAKIRGVKGRGA